MTMPKPARIWAYPGEPVERFGGLWHAPLRQYLLQRLEAQVPGVTELFNLNQGSYEIMSMAQLVAWPGNVFILEQTPLSLDFIDRRSLLACVPPDEREELELFQTWVPRQVSHSSSSDQLETAAEALHAARLRELRIQVTRKELSRWKKARDKSTKQRIGS